MDDAKMDRLLELLEAREARRSAALRVWRIAWPIALAVALLGGMAGGFWWDQARDRAADEQRQCEMFADMADVDVDC